ncbi:hypothetical protein P8452_32144 [Trifolium repens]|nr:hypothetical protein P8452_32144 [Trifolium repens]
MCSISGACGRGRSNHNKSGNKFTNKKEECYNCHRYWHLALKTRNEAAAMRHIWPKIMVTRKRLIITPITKANTIRSKSCGVITC